MLQDELKPLATVYCTVCARPKKLISDDCYAISNLISSDLKLISTSNHDFYCCIFFRKKNDHVFLVNVMLSASYTFTY